MVSVIGPPSISISVKNPGIYTNNSSLEAELTIHVKKAEKVYEHIEAAVVCEEKAGIRHCRSKRREIARVDLAETPLRLSRGTHVIDFSLQLGDISDLPSSMDLIEHTGVFWWSEIYSDKSGYHVDQFPIAVFPTRLVDSELLADLDRSNHKMIRNRLIMIASNNEDAKPLKPKMKVFTAVFGERFRHPDRDELRELGVETKLFVPEAGVLQSPHKTQVGLHIKCGHEKCVVSSKITVKSVSKVTPVQPENTSTEHKSHSATYGGSETSVVCSEQEPNITLPDQWLDISDELADLEIPPVSETTRTQMLEATYELKVTLVFRALHLSNFSRWMNIRTPINVFPSVIEQLELPNAPPTIAPPPLDDVLNSSHESVPLGSFTESQQQHHDRCLSISSKVNAVAPPPYSI